MFIQYLSDKYIRDFIFFYNFEFKYNLSYSYIFENRFTLLFSLINITKLTLEIKDKEDEWNYIISFNSYINRKRKFVEDEYGNITSEYFFHTLRELTLDKMISLKIILPYSLKKIYLSEKQLTLIKDIDKNIKIEYIS